MPLNPATLDKIIMALLLSVFLTACAGGGGPLPPIMLVEVCFQAIAVSALSFRPIQVNSVISSCMCPHRLHHP